MMMMMILRSLQQARLFSNLPHSFTLPYELPFLEVWLMMMTAAMVSCIKKIIKVDFRRIRETQPLLLF
jgi:hypothetical protein